MKHILYIVLFCSYWANAMAVVYDNINQVPNPKTVDGNAFISNPDGILSDETVYSLNVQLDALEQETSAEVAIVALNSIGTQDIESFANALFNHWGIGKSGQDNGVLILFVLDQRAIRFEIGYGLEGALPDAICKRIQMQEMIPQFKDGNYDAGILAGVDMMTKIIKNEPVPELTSENNTVNWENVWLTSLFMIVGIGLFSWIWLRKEIKKIGQDKVKTNINRYVAIRSKIGETLGCAFLLAFVSIFFLLFITLRLQYFVPAAVSMLGAVPVGIWGRWKMQKIRRASILCEVCNGTMHILPKTEKTNYLSVSQQLEKQLKSADYDIFECNSCQNKAAFKLDLSSKYSVCPGCGTKAYGKESSNIIRKATYSKTGIEEQKYTCLFCNYTKMKRKTIPSWSSSSSSSSSGSSSRSSSSFGGGHSGGGGSTSRW